jgi:hypothetical protein
MGFSKIIPSFLRATEDPTPPTTGFPTKDESRNNSVSSTSTSNSGTERRKSIFMPSTESSTGQKWEEGMALPYSLNGAREKNAVHLHHHRDGKEEKKERRGSKWLVETFRMAD